MGILESYTSIAACFEQLRINTSLIRVNIVKGRGQFLNFSARVIGVNEMTESVLLYDVDRKKVEHVQYTEIDDFSSEQFTLSIDKTPNEDEEEVAHNNKNKADKSLDF
ncbi:hypothetical protein GZH47_32285 (plasmid) [Paenibacillus rhizovicinus]|uniref:Uncharacterized protein n=1 Tax=Paenibacillus rhizovicinus TaxID=2704463 RepID=A0A6C0PB26_9BACL|nr:hypothetical protein [Paenibacillus rhizovicinus]QHW35565.1 hypothetical protein GZH47_32285 [Paenibacillus rhizovicinus]